MSLLNVDDIINLYSGILSDRKSIMIVSKSLYDIYAIGSSLISFIDPFEYTNFFSVNSPFDIKRS
jgi:hypothetical protein